MYINVLRHFFFFVSANDVAAFSDDGSIGKRGEKKSSKKSKYFCMHIRHAHTSALCIFCQHVHLMWERESKNIYFYQFLLHLIFFCLILRNFLLSIHGKWFRLLCMQKAAAAVASTTSRSSYSINEKTEKKNTQKTPERTSVTSHLVRN